MSKSQEIQAGSDDESGNTAGRGATSASAPAAARESGADAAREKAKETARERGVTSPFLSALCEPSAGLLIGCRILRHKLDAAGGEMRKALLAWNGGGNPDYAEEVLARMARYR